MPSRDRPVMNMQSVMAMMKPVREMISSPGLRTEQADEVAARVEDGEVLGRSIGSDGRSGVVMCSQLVSSLRSSSSVLPSGVRLLYRLTRRYDKLTACWLCRRMEQ